MKEADPRGDRDIIIDHFNGKVILGAAGGRCPELEAHTLVPKSAMCFGHYVSLYQSLRVDGIVHDLEDATSIIGMPSPRFQYAHLCRVSHRVHLQELNRTYIMVI